MEFHRGRLIIGQIFLYRVFYRVSYLCRLVIGRMHQLLCCLDRSCSLETHKVEIDLGAGTGAGVVVVATGGGGVGAGAKPGKQTCPTKLGKHCVPGLQSLTLAQPPQCPAMQRPNGHCAS